MPKDGLTCREMLDNLRAQKGLHMNRAVTYMGAPILLGDLRKKVKRISDPKTVRLRYRNEDDRMIQGTLASLYDQLMAETGS